MFEALLPHATYGVLVLALTLVVVRLRRKLKKARRMLRSIPKQAESTETSALDAAQLEALLGLAADFLWQTDSDHRFALLSDGAEDIARTLPRGLPELAKGEGGWFPFPEPEGSSIDDLLRQHAPIRTTLTSRNIDDGVRFLELAGLPSFDGEEFTGYRGIGRNITDRIEIQMALSESRARYQEVIDAVREVVFSTDEAKCLTFLNHAWESITSHSASESLGQSLLDFVHPDDRPSAERGLNLVLCGELDEYHGQFRIPTQKGEIRWVEIDAHRVCKRLDGHVGAALAGTLDDISTRKIAEMTLRNINHELEARVRMRTAELEASNRELEAFSYSVSHDLRAPLRSIDGFARILEEDLGDRLDKDSAGHLERIRNAAGRMAQLIDNLIELARLTRHSVRKENVNLSELAIQIIDEIKADEPDRNVEVSITTDLRVTADRTLMRVVLENLLRNAWKFSSRRAQAHIEFTADHDGKRRVFCVRDNGVGFDMAFATHLFRAFHRLHDHTDFPGTGIGLANVQRIIERHGGKIWAESAPDQGASFYFTLDP